MPFVHDARSRFVRFGRHFTRETATARPVCRWTRIKRKPTERYGTARVPRYLLMGRVDAIVAQDVRSGRRRGRLHIVYS